MNGALYTGIKAARYLRGTAGGLGLRPSDLEQALCHEAAPSLPYSDQSDPWLLIQSDQPDGHQSAVGYLWGPPIAQPFNKISDNPPEFCACGDKPEEPVLDC